MVLCLFITFAKLNSIEQAVSAMKQQRGGSGLNITYDLTQQSNPILKGRVNIIGIDFPCLVENEVKVSTLAAFRI